MISNGRIEVREGGVRLDAALLRSFPSTTRAFVRDAIERGDVLIDGRRAAKGLKLRGGETIEVNELLEAKDNLVKPEPEAARFRGEISPNPSDGGACSPLYADDALLAFDKPAGMPVQPLSCRETGTLMNAVVAAYPECRDLGPGLAALGESPLMAGALHRIDADTSGLVLVARTINAFSALRAQFEEQSVEKTYLALVEGEVAAGGTLENDLVHDPTLPFCRMIDAHHNRLTRAQCARLRPLHAVTQFVPRGRIQVESETRTLLEVTIYTGVTHQIRAQLALAGMHIVNDRLYGAFAVEGQTGHCLHAFAARFRHPVSNEPLTIRTPLPAWAAI